MDIDDQVERAKELVKAAQDEVMMAIMFHGTWMPAAYDDELHARMGMSYATHSFHIIRMSLRREMVLALMRLWDTSKPALRMTLVAEWLRSEQFFYALVESRSTEAGLAADGVRNAIRKTLEPQRDAVLKLVRKYSVGGTGFAVFEKLKALRHERLAHRQLGPTSVVRADATHQEIEFFYEDSMELVRLLLSLVLATAFDLTEAAGVYRHYAKLFWANARGERTEGHPNFRSLPKIV